MLSMRELNPNDMKSVKLVMQNVLNAPLCSTQNHEQTRCTILSNKKVDCTQHLVNASEVNRLFQSQNIYVTVLDHNTIEICTVRKLDREQTMSNLPFKPLPPLLQKESSIKVTIDLNSNPVRGNTSIKNCTIEKCLFESNSFSPSASRNIPPSLKNPMGTNQPPPYNPQKTSPSGMSSTTVSNPQAPLENSFEAEFEQYFENIKDNKPKYKKR